MRFIRLFLCLFLGLVVYGNAAHANNKTGQDIRLILQIIVDGLRDDLGGGSPLIS